MNNCLVIIFFIFFHGLVSAQSIKLWPEQNASKKMQRSEMTVYLPEHNNMHVAVIICPGGSYQYLGINHEGHQVAEWLQKNGISAFVLHYRVGQHGNHHPAMIQDLQRAIQLVKENSAIYGINPNKVGVMGFSAGGHLAGMAATYSDINFMKELGVQTNVSLCPNFVALIYPVVSMTDSLAHKKSRKNLLTKHYTPELQQMMSLEQNVHKDMPPIFLVQCKMDRTIDYRNAFYYQQELVRRGIVCDFTLYDESGHGFGIDPKRGGKAAKWNEKFILWIESLTIW
jgi:acetyl esterase/lipase